MVTVSPSPWRARDDHQLCPHWAGLTVRGLWRLRPRQEVVLCADGCHRPCPLAGRRRATREEWSARCTCPGADASRRTFERAAAKRDPLAAVLADIDLSDRPDAETVERRLRAAFHAQGARPPLRLTGLSHLLAAGTARPGTRTARLLGLGARALAGGARWVWQPGAEDRRALRAMYAAPAVLAAIALLLAAGATRASGWRRLPWAVGAVLVSLLTGRSLASGALMTAAVRTATGPPPPDPPPR